MPSSRTIFSQAFHGIVDATASFGYVSEVISFVPRDPKRVDREENRGSGISNMRLKL